MKHNLLSVILIIVIAIINTNCNSTRNNENSQNGNENNNTSNIADADYSLIYSQILDQIYNYKKCQNLGNSKGNEVLAELDYQDNRHIGYKITDISGDNIPELIIGIITNEDDNTGSEIVAAYTYKESSITRAFYAISRAPIYLLKNNHFYYSSTTGENTQFGKYVLSQDGTKFVCNDFCFSEVTNDNSAYYRNSTGKRDISESDKLTTTHDEFFAIAQNMQKDIQKMKFEPLSFYCPPALQKPVSVRWAKDMNIGKMTYNEYSTTESEYQVKVVFTTTREVKDFKILSLKYIDNEEDETFAFSTTELYTQPKLTPGNAFVLTLTIPEVLPEIGFSYIDEQLGTVSSFISVSGMDGSLLLTDFKVK